VIGRHPCITIRQHRFTSKIQQIDFGYAIAENHFSMCMLLLEVPCGSHSDDHRCRLAHHRHCVYSGCCSRTGLRRAGQTVKVSNLPEMKPKTGWAEDDILRRDGRCGPLVETLPHSHDANACWPAMQRGDPGRASCEETTKTTLGASALTRDCICSAGKVAQPGRWFSRLLTLVLPTPATMTGGKCNVNRGCRASGTYGLEAAQSSRRIRGGIVLLQP
jgi:hypothetical protein